jgi:hypothetical protein
VVLPLHTSNDAPLAHSSHKYFTDSANGKDSNLLQNGNENLGALLSKQLDK